MASYLSNAIIPAKSIKVESHYVQMNIGLTFLSTLPPTQETVITAPLMEYYGRHIMLLILFIVK